MFLLQTTLPGTTSTPPQSYGQVLQSNAPMIGIGALLALVGGGTLWYGVGAESGGIFSSLRWVSLVLGGALAASGLVPAKEASAAVPETLPTPDPRIALDVVNNKPPESPPESTKKKLGRWTGSAYETIWLGSPEYAEQYIKTMALGGLNKEKYVEKVAAYLEHSDSNVRKMAAKGLVEGIYYPIHNASSGCARKANEYLSTHLSKANIDKGILEGVLEGIEQVSAGEIQPNIRGEFDELVEMLEGLELPVREDGSLTESEGVSEREESHIPEDDRGIFGERVDDGGIELESKPKAKKGHDTDSDIDLPALDDDKKSSAGEADLDIFEGEDLPPGLEDGSVSLDEPFEEDKTGGSDSDYELPAVDDDKTGSAKGSKSKKTAGDSDLDLFEECFKEEVEDAKRLPKGGSSKKKPDDDDSFF